MSKNSFYNLMKRSIDAQERFRQRWEAFLADTTVRIDRKEMENVLSELEIRLRYNYPFFHPRYAGQMLKPPHDIAIAAYLMAMQINPNNHALDGGPATAALELEVVQQLAQMFGYTQHLGHLTSNGTIANLEALWIAKSIHPEKTIAYSSSAHYTHKRMCEVIGAKHVCLESFDNIEQDIVRNNIGTIVVTIGTTSIGTIEPLHDILPIAKKYGVRIHADCAYGGFFMLLAHDQHPMIDPHAFLKLKECDSITVDPHKHGLQPYGCGCVLFKNPEVGKFYKHDSPYTYFTSHELHLGEISLECSRPGAAAAALWATLQCFPLKPRTGLGPILRKTRTAALQWSSLLNQSTTLCEYAKPDLDIVTYFPRTKKFTATEVTKCTTSVFHDLMNHPTNPLYLATLTVESGSIRNRYPEFVADAPTTTIFRSVLMKPEHGDFVRTLVHEIETAVKHAM